MVAVEARELRKTPGRAGHQAGAVAGISFAREVGERLAYIGQTAPAESTSIRC
jgi:hypothetical protein